MGEGGRLNQEEKSHIILFSFYENLINASMFEELSVNLSFFRSQCKFNLSTSSEEDNISHSTDSCDGYESI